MTTIDAVRQKLSEHAPSLSGRPERNQAAVAIVLWERADDLSLLMIRRAEHEADRWSGHIAFPGGRIDAEDDGPQEAAERETLEEVGLDLARADHIGRLDDVLGFKESIVVSGFVYGTRDPGELHLNHEVADAFWMPIADLLDERRHIRRTFSYRELSIELPALKVLEDGPVLWGITYRFVDELMGLLGHSIPTMPWDPDL